ncbi:up-regulator of cell proliferation-like [Rhinophrynus dorsalis]
MSHLHESQYVTRDVNDFSENPSYVHKLTKEKIQKKHLQLKDGSNHQGPPDPNCKQKPTYEIMKSVLPQQGKDVHNSRGKAFDDLLSQLKMEHHRNTKLSLQDILNVGQETINNIELKSVEDIPWYFLQKVMALNGTARKTTLNQPALSGGVRASHFVHDLSQLDNTDTESNISDSIHHLDVLCVLLNCSDDFLQQEIISKMSMCQFSVPLLLPNDDGQDYTFMLWAMRDIVKRWRPHSLADSKGFLEDSLVNISMPTFSFVRLGKSNISKSKTLNQVLSLAQSYHDIFINQEMDGGDIPKKISGGLVEISWFFPGSIDNADMFQKPFAVTNLRGDVESNWRQFSFLTCISTAVFIFTEHFTDREYNQLLNCRNTDTCYFIVDTTPGKHVAMKTAETLKKLSNVLNVFLVKNSNRNATDLARNLQYIIADYVTKTKKQVSLEDMANTARKLKIKIDENSTECQKAKTHALSITKEIKDVMQYKKETMKLQGDLWKELSRIGKELCRMKNQGNTNSYSYASNLGRKCQELHRKQYKHTLPDGMNQFVHAITHLSPAEKGYFMKWLKFYLDAISRNNLSVLQNEYKEKCQGMSTNPSEIKQLGLKISDSSLGVEHFLRELGQFYEAESSMVKNGQIYPNQRKCSELPGIAADLLLDGFPLELIDGDASNIPLQWVTDVLMELDKKTQNRCRMRVISVLGVQSTGKSTLLNTMFGLQFPVASGRCTRGAFMTLLKVKDNLQKELGCQFILVIDTEGLKALELESLEDSYEHDNELATLVVGLSDIAIVNMAMENTTEMKDTLQIVVHAFLRMNEVGKKPNCHLVHQNVSDVTAYDKNMTSRTKLLKELNEMTKVASKMEKRNRSMDFSDIINYHPDKHSWYIPGLWHGVPPMAPINCGYSEHVFKLKKCIFEFMKENHSPGPQNMASFIEWINSLWNAVKYETFIFSFRNILVAEAYEQLSMKYSELEWNFRKQVHMWLTKNENIIRNQSSNNTESQISTILQNFMNQLLDKEEAHMTQQLSKFFGSGSNNVHLVERYREDFLSYVKSLRRELEIATTAKCWEAVQIQNGKHEIQNIQDNCMKFIEEKVNNRLKHHKWKQCDVSDTELRQEFEAMWDTILLELQLSRLRKHRIDVEMLDQLKKEMKKSSSAIWEKLHRVKSLKGYGEKPFEMDKHYIEMSLFSIKGLMEIFTKEYSRKLNNIALLLEDSCQDYVTEKINSKEDYNEIYCQELLKMINQRLNKEDVRKLHATPFFELDLKLHILGRAAPRFQKMHDDFGLNNDPKLLINKLKPQYFSIFKNKLKLKDESKIRASDFCEQCLKPAITDHINKILGKEIIDDILKSADAVVFKSQKQFHFTVLKELLEKHDFEEYVEYINKYEFYVKRWISKYIVNKYKNVSDLENLIVLVLSSITKKVQAALTDPKVQKSRNVSEFLEIFCTVLSKHLVISKNAVKIIIFQNTADIHQFSADIRFFLSETETQIRSEMKLLTTETIISHLRLNPRDELFKKVVGCGKTCPFCNVPCEAGVAAHQEHFVSAHRPKGLAQYKLSDTNSLCTSICSTDIISKDTFRNPDTEGKWLLYKDYRTVYPDWIICPEQSLSASNYWKFVLTQFNDQFAKYYKANPAVIPEEWKEITQRQAFTSLQEIYSRK